MLSDKVAELIKKAGANNPGVPDGTGPYKGSFRRNVEGKSVGRRMEAGETCPVTGESMSDKVEKAKKKKKDVSSMTKEELLALIRSDKTGSKEDEKLLKILRNK